jgi:hypothetical protein
MNCVLMGWWPEEGFVRVGSYRLPSDSMPFLPVRRFESQEEFQMDNERFTKNNDRQPPCVEGHHLARSQC